MWVLNELRVTGPRPDLTGEELRAELDRELGDGGGHRRAVVEDEKAGRRVYEDFKCREGWRAGPVAIMALLGDPPPEPPPGIAREVGEEEFRVVDAALTAADDAIPAEDRDVVVAGTAQLRAATGARMFVGARNGVDASRTTLFTDGHTGQPEIVDTLAEHRGHGLAAATVALATRSAVDAGCDFVFILCDAISGPVPLYASLGFVVIGRYWVFTRPA